MTRGREDQEDAPGHLRLDISFGSVALVLLAIAAALVAAGVLVEARRIISWVVACAVAAALIELLVEWLDRWMARALAIVLVLVAIAGTAGLLVFGVFHDLDQEARRLKIEAPLAAQSIERNEQLGGLAREIDLDRRVTDATQRLSSPSSGLASEAVDSVGAYVVCAVLTILFLSWGKRLARAGLKQLEPRAAERARWVVSTAFGRSRRYVVLALLQASTIGALAWGLCMWLDLPAPLPLALALTACALIPSIGIVLGSLPIMLLTAGLEAGVVTASVSIGFLVVQVLSNRLLLPRIVRISGLNVGSAAIVIGSLIGFELYGIGGAIYAAALTVLGVALIDATTESEDVEPSALPEPRREAHTAS